MRARLIRYKHAKHINAHTEYINLHSTVLLLLKASIQVIWGAPLFPSLPFPFPSPPLPFPLSFHLLSLPFPSGVWGGAPAEIEFGAF